MHRLTRSICQYTYRLIEFFIPSPFPRPLLFFFLRRLTYSPKPVQFHLHPFLRVMQSTRTYGELREYAKEKETEGTVTSASTYNTRTYVTRTLYARTQVRSTG